jgi:hypothetical protein
MADGEGRIIEAFFLVESLSEFVWTEDGWEIEALEG